MDTNIYSLDKVEWDKVRPDIAINIFSKSLLPKKWTDAKIVYTKVLPDGEFSDHVDNYHHVLLFLKGSGLVKVGKRLIEITPNLVVEIPAGVEHGYKNEGIDELVLITVNIPVSK